MQTPHPLTLPSDLQLAFSDAALALGRLDAQSIRPDSAPLRRALQHQEAEASARIDGRPAPYHTAERDRHHAALDWGLLQIRNGFPLSTRLLRGVYAKLADIPAVPPLPDQVTTPMVALERFLTDVPARTPALLKAAIAYPQLAAIAPFPDRNGSVGRLLIALVLCADGALREPWLGLSPYITRHHPEHDHLLNQLGETGHWDAWLRFFANGVTETATSAVRTTEELVSLFTTDRERVLAAGRPTKSTLAVFDALRERPINKAPFLAEQTGLTLPTVITALERLQTLGIVDEITGKRRNRTYRYSAYILRLSEGTEPLSPP